ncbi:MAG: SDR family oxidoreductase [Balneolaceae bacterium]
MILNGANAIVTGASSGLGRSIASFLTQEGTRVYGMARRTDRLQELQNTLGEAFIPVPMDITDRQAVKDWVARTFNDEQQPDILVNNAGLAHMSAVDKQTDEEWDQMIDTNLTATFTLTRELVPHMKSNPAVCHILNIASVAGLIGNPELSGYNASKFAVRGFSEALFKELRYDGIKVSCMYPGSIDTEFFDKSGMTDRHPNMMHPDDVARTALHLITTPDNLLINEVALRPLNPKRPE